jgi:hypothetical protein
MVQTTEKRSFQDSVNLIWHPWRKSAVVEELAPYENSDEPVRREAFQIYNKLPHNHHLSNKKTFFQHLQEFYLEVGRDPWDALPVTFHVHECSEDDSEWRNFCTYYEQMGDFWIIKPGENSNCG